ncbi:hypothetical protein [Streptomyces sp. NPDC001568]|uniref:hypothetical protein n=1 Tax=Streptomyces sp. NPDC001568 TaxID=3364588 RepID=UPI0036C1DEE8
MVSLTHAAPAPRAVRQLCRIRAAYASGFALWAGAAAWEGWHRPGSRQMWVLVLLVALFTGLLCLTVASLYRLRRGARSAPAPAAGRSGARSGGRGPAGA